MNSGGHIPLLAKEGRPLASDGSECVLKHLRVSDHPVCGASVASRLLIDAAATPPHEEGNAPTLNSLVIHSQLFAALFILMNFGSSLINTSIMRAAFSSQSASLPSSSACSGLIRSLTPRRMSTGV